MKFSRTTIAAAIVVIAAGLYLSSGSSPSPNPFVPTPPKPDRPVMSVLAKIARTLLWLALLGEDTEPDEGTQMVHARCDENGNPLLDHGRGW